LAGNPVTRIPDFVQPWSSFNSPAESNYAPIKGECFGVASALHKSRYYSLGCDKLLVSTDHKQLLGVLNDRSLESIDNPRLICKGENFALSRAVTPVQCEVQMMALGQGDINPGQHLSRGTISLQSGSQGDINF
jgi:hypothetical protein